jgi:hypothetical protein
MIRQDAVFDRTEQRRDRAEQEQRGEQGGQRVEREARARQRCYPDLDQFEAPCHHRLIETIRELAAKTREEEERRDEDSTRQRDQRLGVLAADLEQNQKDERVLEEVIVEGRKELAPEQRREAAGGHQGCGHSVDPLAKVPLGRPRMPVCALGSLNRPLLNMPILSSMNNVHKGTLIRSSITSSKILNIVHGG